MTEKSASDVLRELLDERGIEWKDGDAAYEIEWSTPDGRHCSAMYWKPTFTVLVSGCTPEQAVAATLENDPYDAVSCEHVISSDTLHLILDEWDVHPGWTATNENMAQLFGHTAVTLGGGKLTAEQVRKAVERHGNIMDNRLYEDWQAVADDLNELGSGTCKITATSTNSLMYPDYMTKWYELSCGHSLILKGDEAPKWCAVCGKAVER